MVGKRTADRLDARLATEQSEQRLPSVVAGLVRDGELIWSGGRGKVDGSTPDADVQYRCGSITKTFIGVSVMRLRDEGALRLQDTVDRFLPDTGIGDLTIAQLMSHTAGMRAETGEPWWERTPGGDFEQLTRTTLRSGTRFDAGRRFHYSNVGFGVLGQIVATIRRRRWDEVVADELLTPLGMTRTTTRPQSPAASGFAVHPWADVLLPEPEHDAGAMAPAGQLWMTIADLARWTGFLSGHGPELLSADTLAEMREPRGINDIRGDGWDGAYGLGLQVFNDDGKRWYGHGGSMPGFLAGFEFDDDGDGVVEMCNATRGLTDLGGELVKILREEEPRVPDEWTPEATPPAVLELLGAWYWGPYPYVLVAHGDELELTAIGRGRESRFTPAGTEAWVGLDGYHTGEPLRVIRLSDGSISHLDLGSFVFTRTPYDSRADVPGGVDPGGWRA
jgi:CubicO group peptidase (beta-lactamase class C family)